MGELGTYEGREVVGTAIVIRKTGDGLSEAMRTEPRNLAIGESVTVVLEAVVVDVHHPAENRKDPAEGGVKRLHVLDAGTATFVDRGLVAEILDDQAERNRVAREAESGQLTLERCAECSHPWDDHTAATGRADAGCWHQDDDGTCECTEAPPRAAEDVDPGTLEAVDG